MKLTTRSALLLLIGGASFASLSACGDNITNCEERLSCDTGGEGGVGASGGDAGDGDGDTSSGGAGGSGGAASGGRSSGGNGSGGADPCDLCTDETPVCLEDKSCAACTSDETGSCEASEVCSDENTCVQCTENEHCSEADASVCDLETNTCVGCSENAECSHLEDLTFCEEGVCVQCTPATDDRTVTSDACEERVCDPTTLTCDTSLSQATKDTCQPCIADVECLDGQNCIPLQYTGGGTAVEVGGFCMKLAPGCSPPYQAGAIHRASLSGAAAADYCGLAEQFTTCEAIADLVDGTSCTMDEECGSTAGEGRCETVNLGEDEQCTYSCTLSSQCVSGAECDGVVGDMYCGG